MVEFIARLDSNSGLFEFAWCHRLSPNEPAEIQILLSLGHVLDNRIYLSLGFFELGHGLLLSIDELVLFKSYSFHLLQYFGTSVLKHA